MLFILGFKCFVQFVKKMLVNPTEKWHRRNNNLIGGPDVFNNQMIMENKQGTRTIDLFPNVNKT